MATDHTPPHVAEPASRLRSYARLGKVGLVEIWLGPVVAAAAVLDAGSPVGRTLLLSLLFLLAIAFGMGTTHALDDVTGFRDGSDARNYAPERRRSQVKPLVTGDLTVRQARSFAALTGGASIACIVLFCVVAEFQPWWVFVGGLAVIVLGSQYSAGINFSYRIIGGGEILTGTTLAASTLIPYAAATVAVDRTIGVESVLFGLWLVMVLMCSNSRDADDDRLVGRRTIAALTSVHGNRVAMASVFLASWGLIVVAVSVGALTPVALLTLAPCVAVQGYVLRHGLRGVWRHHRNLGFVAVRLGVAGLVVMHVL
jgi:1,4-dihydroxy-2-naphthoate polyprenyltransferase